MMSVRSPHRRLPNHGCLGMLVLGVITCGLILINSVWITECFPLVVTRLPFLIGYPKLQQSLLFVLPVIISLAQWWLIDLIQDRRRAARGQ
ncbi:MAG: hypothetical protein ACKOU6_03565 [Planctomycetota bacterium]